MNFLAIIMKNDGVLREKGLKCSVRCEEMIIFVRVSSEKRKQFVGYQKLRYVRFIQILELSSP